MENNVANYWEMLPDIAINVGFFFSTLTVSKANPGIFKPGQLVHQYQGTSNGFSTQCGVAYGIIDDA